MQSDVPTSGVKATITYEHNPFFAPQVEVDVLAGYGGTSGEYIVARFSDIDGWKPWDQNIKVTDKYDYVNAEHPAYLDEHAINLLGNLPVGGELKVGDQVFWKLDWKRIRELVREPKEAK